MPVWVFERGMRDGGEHVGDRSAVEFLPKTDSHSINNREACRPIANATGNQVR